MWTKSSIAAAHHDILARVRIYTSLDPGNGPQRLEELAAMLETPCCTRLQNAEYARLQDVAAGVAALERVGVEYAATVMLVGLRLQR
jgi:hypothetical protein